MDDKKIENSVDSETLENIEEKHAWQKRKEEVYSHLNITVKQLDIIIGLCIAGLIIVGIMITLDAIGII